MGSSSGSGAAASTAAVGDAAAGLALAATGCFAGAALFVTLVDFPEMMENPRAGYASFPGFYARAAKLQGGLAFVGSHAAMVAAATAPADANLKLGWRAGGLLLGFVWPWTVFAMLPLNKQILKQEETDEAKQRELLGRWGRLHLVRTVASVAALATVTAVVLKRRGAAS